MKVFTIKVMFGIVEGTHTTVYVENIEEGKKYALEMMHDFKSNKVKICHPTGVDLAIFSNNTWKEG